MSQAAPAPADKRPMSASRDTKYAFTDGQRSAINSRLAGILSPKLLSDDPDWIASDVVDAGSALYELLDFEVSLIYPRSNGRTVLNATGTAEPVLSYDGHSWPMPPALRALLVDGAPIEDFDALRGTLNGVDFDDPARVKTPANDSLAWSEGHAPMFAGHPYTQLLEGSSAV